MGVVEWGGECMDRRLMTEFMGRWVDEWYLGRWVDYIDRWFIDGWLLDG